jgi:mono/diheme cytochrome c family protein
MRHFVALTFAVGAGLVVAGSSPSIESAPVPSGTQSAADPAPSVVPAHPGLDLRQPDPAAERAADELRTTGADPTDPEGAELDVEAVVEESCVRCHNDRRLRGNLSLADFSLATLPEKAAVGEEMIRKLRAGFMPPPSVEQPGGDTLVALVEALEATLDEAAFSDPNPGHRSFQRLNRAEYERAVHDLLGLDVDAGNWLPLDQKQANFDNIADAQPLSPTLLEAYLNAAAEISRLAVGNREAASENVAYKVPEYVSQHPWDQVEGAPYGTRGGLVVDHVFPADGEYVFEMSFASGENAPLEDLDVSIDGERVALLPFTRRGVGADGRGSAPMQTEPIFIRAGQHSVSVAWVKRTDGPYEDLIRPHVWSMAGGGAGGAGITTLPHLRDVIVQGPLTTTGVSETQTRRRIFTCRPTTPEEEEPCARSIVERLATDAYRRPVRDEEVDALMEFYRDGAARDGFEIGVRYALEAVLSSPFFVLRLEQEPEGVQPGETYVLSDYDLASRLSFFLWGAPPDDELLEAAADGRLRSPDGLEAEARRMLEDERAGALGERFAAQWLRLQDLYKVRPDPNFYPNFDENLADAMHTETELVFNSLVREEKSVLDFYTTDYTFVNERLAQHYGIPGVSGDEFQRVEYPAGRRQGVLGHGSVLVLTSLANRTSPVLRGKWVMEVLMGTPPPPPPPNVPELDEAEGEAGESRFLTTGQKLAIHRQNPSCNSCHSLIDPIGLALDSYDVTGKWRMRENGAPLDTEGEFYDGTPITSPADLNTALLKRPIPLVRSFTENLMAYALGRRVEYFDQPTVRKIVRESAADGYRMSDIILGVVASDAFRMKRALPAATEETQTSIDR